VIPLGNSEKSSLRHVVLEPEVLIIVNGGEVEGIFLRKQLPMQLSVFPELGWIGHVRNEDIFL
jgi:hypothetical protein